MKTLIRIAALAAIACGLLCKSSKATTFTEGISGLNNTSNGTISGQWYVSPPSTCSVSATVQVSTTGSYQGASNASLYIGTTPYFYVSVATNGVAGTYNNSGSQGGLAANTYSMILGIAGYPDKISGAVSESVTW
jgi:hypothetical protein